MGESPPLLPALSIGNVGVSYGRKKIINDLSLEVKAGETFGLIGLNGTGKTTLIKAVLGLRRHESGQIAIDGLDHLDPASKEKISYLPERFDPPWFLTGMEFIRFSLTLYKVEKKEEEIRKAAERLALDPAVLANRVQTYSKGMRQKLGLMGALLPGTKLLILDEPMSGLDPKARTKVKDMLLEARAAGRTIFLSSHILSDMQEICDRVAVLSGGVLVYTGTPQGLCATGRHENIERAFLNVIDEVKAA